MTFLGQDLLNLCTNLTNPSYFCQADTNVGMIIYEFDKLIEENPKITWTEIDWLLDNVYAFPTNHLHHFKLNIFFQDSRLIKQSKPHRIIASQSNAIIHRFILPYMHYLW